MNKTIFFLLALLTVFSSCQNDDDFVNDTDNNEPYLVSFDLITTVSAAEVQLIINSINEFNFSLNQNHDISAYAIEYKTKDVTGEDINASGAIMVPNTPNASPVLSLQHGTINSLSEAPSQYDDSGELLEGAILASGGYAVIMPDYLGYGSSSHVLHPYEHAKSLGSASFDMIQAAKEFFENNNINVSDKLFLTGYSEGGNATMALHKHIEENSDWEVTMSAPAAGAYNKTAFALDIVQRDENLNFLPDYMWAFDSYSWIYDIERNWNQIVNEPHATTLEGVLNPMNYGAAPITLNPSILFTDSFIENFTNGNDTEMLNAFADNDIYDWTPVYPITLYYGTADDFVFPLNSTTAYNAITQNGGIVTKKEYIGADHDTTFPLYFEDMYELFESLR